MKRKTIAFILIVVFAVSAVAGLVYTQVSELQNQIGELQAQNDELQEQIGELQNQNSALQDKLDKIYEGPVQITAVEMTGWWPIVGVAIGSLVNVTVQNQGFTDFSGLTLTVRLLKNNTEVGTEFGHGYVQQIDMLRAGESREFSGGILYVLGSSFEIESTVKLGDVILDKYTQTASWT